MDENKTMSIAVLGVVAVISVVSVVLLLTNNETTGYSVKIGDKIYGGALRDNAYPCRLVNGKTGTCQEEIIETQIPYRTYNQVSTQRPSWQTSCGPDYIAVDGFNRASDFETRYDTSCMKLNGGQDGRYCCPKVNYAKGELIE